MRPVRRGTAIAVYAALALVVVAGIWFGTRGHGATAVTLSPSASVAPTMPAPVASPAKPDRWASTGSDGAAAAAVWFVGPEYRYVIETNDLTEWQRLSNPQCVFCQNLVSDTQDNIRNGYVDRQRGEATVTVTRVEEADPLTYGVLVDLYQPSGLVYRTNGEPTAWSFGEDHNQILVVVIRVGLDWQLRAGQAFPLGTPVPTTGSTQ